ncbi:flagellar hook-length control protein FliK [Rossellomorea sp. AcN35-11]|nr:flagellar hook-length control protein FliK [Rossellomorea aquimaris]WJV28912.1 flagellar hook-length control protein FliK [Rossellomorea sp. AcN35-11]
MEIGIGSQLPTQVAGISKGSSTMKNEIDGFSKFLGYVSSQVDEIEEVNMPDSQALYVTVQSILRITELNDEGLGLTNMQLAELTQLEEFDFERIAEILDVDNETINPILTELQSRILGNLAPVPASGGDVHEVLVSTMQLLHTSIIQEKDISNEDGAIERIVKLVKVIELMAAKRDLFIVDASKTSELKDMVKMVQQGVEGYIAKKSNQVNWTGVLKESLRRSPIESLEKLPSIERVTGEKKAHQSIQGSHLHFVLPKTESVSMNLPMSNRSLHHEQFVKEFQNILSKSQLVSQPNMSKLLIKLYPEQLGSLRIEILQQNGVMTAKILASTATAKEMLDSQIQGLKQAFTSQNLQVEKIEVSQALTDADRQSKGQSQQQSSEKHKQHDNDHEGNREEERTQSFKDYLVNTEI